MNNINSNKNESIKSMARKKQDQVRYWPSEIITKKQIKEDLITQPQQKSASEHTCNKSEKNAPTKPEIEQIKKQIPLDMPSIFEQQEPTERGFKANQNQDDKSNKSNNQGAFKLNFVQTQKKLQEELSIFNQNQRMTNQIF